MLSRLMLSTALLTTVFFHSNVQAAETEFEVAAPTAEALRQTLKDVREAREQGLTDHVIVTLPPGVVLLEETLQLTPAEVGNGLTLKAKERGKSVLSGTIGLKSLGKNDQGQWRFALPAETDLKNPPRAVIIEQEMQTPARHPNQGYFRIDKAFEDRRSGFTTNPGDIPDELSADTGYCDLVLLHDWSSSRIPVASYDAETKSVHSLGPIGCAAKHYAIDHFEKQPRYWLEGHPLFADQPGEWFIDRDVKELLVVAGDEKQAPEVRVPGVEVILHAAGTDKSALQKLTLDGLVFSGSHFPMPAGGMATGQASVHERRADDGSRPSGTRVMLSAAVQFEIAENCRIQGCQFVGLGNSGLWLGQRSSNFVVRDCRFEEIGGNGLNIGEENNRRINGKTWYHVAPEQVPTNNRVEKCKFRFCGEILPGSVAIWGAFNRNLLIAENEILDCPYTGISLGWMWNKNDTPARDNVIRDNRIQYTMQVLSDGGGIYTLGKQPNSIIENNLITDIPLNAGRAESNGMFFDQGSMGFLIRNNTIRRVDKSPLRFHQAGTITARDNRWELAEGVPPVRYNNTPEENITLENNTVIEPQTRIFLIGNSLTWDTVPSRLEEAVEWHVDCGKPLEYIRANPDAPCVGTSRIWPIALRSAEYDFLSVQPHYGSGLEADVETISHWLKMQPKAICVIHTGWARSAELAEEYADDDPAGPPTHSSAYYDELLSQLKERFPEREFRTTGAMHLLHSIEQDIAAGKAPIDKLSDLYRDAIHMTTSGGRYLMHNRMRQTLGQPLIDGGFGDIDPELKAYLDRKLAEQKN